MSDQQSQYVRCANNPDHIYPAYMSECDICALMRNRPANSQAPTVVGVTSAAAAYPPQPSLYGQQVGPYGQQYAPQAGTNMAYQSLVTDEGEEQPSDQFIFKKYGIPLLIAAGVLAFLLVVVNAPHPAPAPTNGISVAANDSPTPPARRGSEEANYVQLPKVNPQADNFAPTSSPAVTAPTYVRVDSAGGTRYYSDADLIGSWQVIRDSDNALLGTYMVDKVTGKLVAHSISWNDGPAPGDLNSGSYDGVRWNLSGDKTNPDSLSYTLDWSDGGLFSGTASGAKPAFKVTWHKVRLQSAVRSGYN